MLYNSITTFDEKSILKVRNFRKKQKNQEIDVVFQLDLSSYGWL